jgi:hypothetical protein
MLHLATRTGGSFIPAQMILEQENELRWHEP